MAWLLAAVLIASCGDDGAVGPPVSASSGFVDEDLFRARQLDYLRFATQSLSPASVTNVIAHLERKHADPTFQVPAGAVPVDAWDAIFAKLARLDDTRDFEAIELLYILYEYRDDPLLAPGLAERVEEALASFKFWYSEASPSGAIDNTYYWTENHQILFFFAIEYLTGQLFPDRPIGTDLGPGHEHRQRARARLLRWIEHRARFGFSEWHSNVYYQEDMNALLTLVELAGEEEEEEDPAAPYGFSYRNPEDLVVWWGMSTLTAWQIVPLTLETMEQYDLWESELFRPFARLRPLVANVPFAQTLARAGARFISFGHLSEVSTYTYRTADYMLSSALDYRKGSLAAQGHSWQLTFDPDALLFTMHPAKPIVESAHWRDDDESTGGYWTGEASFPRAAQHENVGVYIYAPQWDRSNPPPFDPFFYQPYTHAYVPQDHFDEVVQEGSWTFVRFREAFAGLYSYRPTRWIEYDPAVVATNGMTRPFDLRAEGGADNVWIVEAGTLAEWGSFAAFRAALSSAPVRITPRAPAEGDTKPSFDVDYSSPSIGRVTFGWYAPFTVGGREMPLFHTRRFDNPWAQTDFDQLHTRIEDEQFVVELDFENGVRRVEIKSAQR